MEAGALSRPVERASAGCSAAAHLRALDAAWFEPLRRWLVPSDPRAIGRLDLELLNRFAAERAVRTIDGIAVRFVDASAAPPRRYECTVRDTGRVPTRTHGAGMLHDWFNALAWLAFPHTKARLNALHADTISQGTGTGTGATPRGRLRDAATLFDESGAYLVCDDHGWPAQALRDLDWPALFVTERERFRSKVCVVLVGHALYEKLLEPYRGICARVWLLEAPQPRTDSAEPEAAGSGPCGFAALDRLDADGAAQLRADALCASRLLPLPLLGVPGWWPANEDPAFYDDAKVFRRSRSIRTRSRPQARRMYGGAGRAIAGADACVGPEEGPDSTGQDAG